eukprot:CAMPEP_0196780074 /NCGR_PEP_ID=MMETSP1104-20130614/6982_1 /TAXON_ID=33652 /ORGANISM="Cafeteria sp., Strain Caron Lab Isolate" /LENGTH=231 /DNA_ID=CAMNT_0042150263 /DNA_START=46 /DNA_END=743 /DNA_ORIENTATION=+
MTTSHGPVALRSRSRQTSQLGPEQATHPACLQVTQLRWDPDSHPALWQHEEEEEGHDQVDDAHGNGAPSNDVDPAIVRRLVVGEDGDDDADGEKEEADDEEAHDAEAQPATLHHSPSATGRAADDAAHAHVPLDELLAVRTGPAGLARRGGAKNGGAPTVRSRTGDGAGGHAVHEKALHMQRVYCFPGGGGPRGVFSPHWGQVPTEEFTTGYGWWQTAQLICTVPWGGAGM